MALLSVPTIFSPITAVVFKDKPDTNVRPSSVGIAVSFYSYTARIFITSGTFKDISLSSTLKP